MREFSLSISSMHLYVYLPSMHVGHGSGARSRHLVIFKFHCFVPH